MAGPTGGKLHTGRSRNDQIALDERLYLRDVLDHVDAGLVEVERALVAQAEKHGEAPMPGYTHLQRAQPVLLAHHLLAYVFMLERDRARFRDGRARVNVMPLGAAALAGAAFAIDREALARDLGFAAPSPNSMDAVADRDFVVEFLSHAAILGMHCSRLAADLTLWATAEFGFVEFSDAFATGSSIMPQKKNPDVAELLRGKTGRLYGNLTAALTVMKGLPLTYNSDMQEDKEPLFDTVDTLEAIFRVLPPMLGSLTFRVERMREAAGANYSTATDLADYLVRQGLPFREAHEVVGRAVRHAITRGRELGELPLEELRQFSSRIGPTIRHTVEASCAPRGERHRAGRGPPAARPGRGAARARAGGVRRARAAPLLACGALVACGKKGPPVAPELRVPMGPAGLRGAVDEQSIVVSWTGPGVRVDGSRLRSVALYRLYRREEAPNGPPRSAMLSSGRIVGYDEIAAIRPEAPAPAAVQGTSVTWVDQRALAFGRRYVYVVTAEDVLGRTSGPSERLIVPYLAAPKLSGLGVTGTARAWPGRRPPS
jgi:argininosuccinate lyase